MLYLCTSLHLYTLTPSRNCNSNIVKTLSTCRKWYLTLSRHVNSDIVHENDTFFVTFDMVDMSKWHLRLSRYVSSDNVNADDILTVKFNILNWHFTLNLHIESGVWHSATFKQSHWIQSTCLKWHLNISRNAKSDILQSVYMFTGTSTPGRHINLYVCLVCLVDMFAMTFTLKRCVIVTFDTADMFKVTCGT